MRDTNASTQGVAAPEEKRVLLAPSLLSADFWHLGASLRAVENSVDFLHFDVMDGHYVPNISFGFPLLECVRKHSKKTLDVHLMIDGADLYLEQFAEKGADILTLHYEAIRHHDRSLKQIRRLGMKAGLALNPGTSLSAIEELVPLLDLLLIMTVEPGFGGQPLCAHAEDKVRRARRMLDEKNPDCLLEVDGGVNRHSIAGLSAAGADVFVAGTAIFASEDPAAACVELRELAKTT